MAAGFSPEFLRGFGEVIGQQNITQVRVIINSLRARNDGRRFFIDEIVNLPIANLSNVAGNMGTLTCSDIPRGETVRKVGGGTYGTVYVGQTYFHAYKRMTINGANRTDTNSIENYCREVYLEAFIQYYLQNDPTYGDNICSIQKLYRDVTVTRSGININLTRPYIFYYRMEPIPGGTIDEYLNRSRDVTGLVPFTTIQPKLLELATILGHFETTYGFHHRDLHTGNVMFNGDDIKIIDFGMGCVTINGQVYSVNNAPCRSYDLLIYTVALYENYRDRFDQTTVIFLRSFFQLENGMNILDFMRDHARRYNEAMFWQAYHYKLSPEDAFWRRMALGHSLFSQFRGRFVNFTPQNFATIVEDYDPGAAAAAGPAGAAAENSLCKKCWDATLGRLGCCGTRNKTQGGKRRCPRCLQKYKKRKHTHKKHRVTHKR